MALFSQVKRQMSSAVAGAVLLFGTAATAAIGTASAQTAGDASQPPAAPWASQCSSEGRGAALECVMEQRVVMSTTGQLLVAVTIRQPPEGGEPVMLLHTPYGIHLPAGLALAVDGRAFETLQVQTCDNQGCFADSRVSSDLLAALKAGNNLEVTFQDQGQRDITVPVSLVGFTAAFANIQ